ncbi:hypothetical protein FRB98_007361 [Tulasnella sp. 332]|nr:hypothetical protein FRB98_007361 [Tulasnella sp. 332]
MPSAAVQPQPQMATTTAPTTTTSTTSPPTARNKMPRSMTAQTGNITPAPQPARPRRTMSEDSSSPEIRVARSASTRTKSNGANGLARPSKEKPSLHADAIDTLDNTGLGVGMFHHDGPFDACAPSRNKSNKTHRAPMFAFGPDQSSSGTTAGGGANSHNVPVFDKRLSPLAAHTIAAMAQSDGNAGPYPASAVRAGSNGAGSTGSGGMTMFGGKLGPSPRKMTLTEAWGTAEPQPFEEFSAGTGRQSARSSFEQPPDGAFEAMYKKDARAAASRRGESLDVPRRPNKLPPPQPIFLPGSRSPNTENVPNGGGGMPPPTDGGPQTPSAAVSRSRSLMQRIRKMRDNPNVPVGGAMAAPETSGGYFSDAPPSSYGTSNYTSTQQAAARTPGGRTGYPQQDTLQLGSQTPALQQPYQQQQVSSKPSHHRTHTRGHSKEQALQQQQQQQQQQQPQQYTQQPYQVLPPRRQPTTVAEEPFVMVDRGATVAAAREKALPPPPGTQSDAEGLSWGGASRAVPQPQSGAGIGRKISLYKKMKGAVVGSGGGGGGVKN